MVKTLRDSSRPESSKPNSKHAGKSLRRYPFLSPELSELLHTSCRLAGGDSTAMGFISDGIHDIHEKVSGLRKKFTYISKHVSDGCSSPIEISTRNKTLKPFETVLTVESENPTPACSSLFPYVLANDEMEMIDAIELRYYGGEEDSFSDTVIEFGTPQQLGVKLNLDHKKDLGEKLGLPVRLKHNLDMQSEVLCDVTRDIVGEQIEVFSVSDQCWRSALVSCKLPDGQHALVFFDGVVERLMLHERLWRSALCMGLSF